MLILFQIPAAKIYNHPRTKWVKNRAGVLPIFISLCIDSPPLSKNRRSPLRRFLLREGDFVHRLIYIGKPSLRSCPPPIIPLCLSREEGMIHFCKKARIWTFFWLGRKQYGWFVLFQLAKMPPSVSCGWFQSAFLLAQWAVNSHASLL